MIGTASLLNEPGILEPVNKELWFRVNNPSYSVADFKYVFRLHYLNEPFENRPYVVGPTYRIPARPNGGDGLYSPDRYLRSFFKYELNPWQEGFDSNLVQSGNIGIPDGLYKYKVEYGFEYNPSLAFTGTFNASGNLGLSFSVQHGFQSGDSIIINKDNKLINSAYDGTASITTINGSFSFTTNKPFGATAIGETGLITYLQRLSATSSERLAFNGTRQYLQREFDFSKYRLSGSTSSFLTTYNGGYKPVQRWGSGESEWETLSMILTGPTSSLTKMEIWIYDYSGATMSGYTFALSGFNRYRRIDFGVGPANLNLASGFDFNDPNVDYYSVQLYFNGAISSEKRKYRMVDECTLYDRVRLVFLNRLGGFDYFTFTRDKKKSVSIKRNEYQKILDWNYEYGKTEQRSDRGATIYSTEADESFTLQSNWITEKDAIWLEELMTSPDVYIIEYEGGGNDFRNGRRLPIIITNTNYEVKTQLRDKLFNISVSYRYATPINLQNE